MIVETPRSNLAHCLRALLSCLYFKVHSVDLRTMHPWHSLLLSGPQMPVCVILLLFSSDCMYCVVKYEVRYEYECCSVRCFVELWATLIALMMEAARTSETLVKFLPDYVVLQPRRQPSSYSLPWEPQIILFLFFFISYSCSYYCRWYSLFASIIDCSFVSFKINNNFQFHFRSGDYSWPL
jgi:hypothetical protein